MTKAELIAGIGKEAKISKASAEKAVNAFTKREIKIPATRVAKFKAGNLLRSAVK